MIHPQLQPRLLKWLIVLFALGTVFFSIAALSCPLLPSENRPYDCIGSYCPVAYIAPQKAVFAL